MFPNLRNTALIVVAALVAQVSVVAAGHASRTIGEGGQMGRAATGFPPARSSL